ncbi:peptide-N(4)-(N-acetyl-beta-glucosaminyl)asparagine amidase isoform X1 [Schistocerca americana]|uniref:peptide-N(4)-(N-acetyl-beta- glucosaminyl)asparagine amidase isoform X1 n=2 Tax=Schistocerca americana TaxID=7009 RepID=UPI001F4F8FA3|nr:peptide-N(4)-(N-acetyl-beta-glucosaminyl)asparagine amidase isoform X1 [Schistocerca americana]
MTRRCVVLLERNETNMYLSTTELLLKIVDAVLQEPSNPKARTYKLASPAVSEKLRATVGAMECLREMGFQEMNDKLVLSPEASLENIRQIRSEIVNRRRNYETFNAVNNSSEMSSASSEGASATQHTSFAHFKSQLLVISETVLGHENKLLQKKALKLIPLTELEIKAVKHMRSLQKAIKNGAEDNGADVQDILLLELMAWFKESFFSWVDSPKCWFCQGETKFRGHSSDPKYNGDRAEVYMCTLCREVTLFVRYNKTEKLLETRKGRCSEWANCFALLCKSLGWDVRVVYDVTDHLWVEVFSVSQQRWIHCDPCENAYDKPLMYEVGWKKNLSYVIAFSYDDVQDVTWRYTCNFNSVLRRRNLCSEQQLLDIMFAIREKRQRDLSLARKEYLKKRMLKELVEFLTPPKQTDAAYEGRTSGSLLWRLARGEVTEKVTYVWTPNAAEISAQRFQLSYSCEKDKYFRSTNTEEACISGWQNGVFEFDSVFRKEEKDWKMFYLSRTEGSPKGTITWKFDFSSSGLVIETVNLVFVRSMFENGVIKLLMIGDTNNMEVPSSETAVSTKVLDGSKCLTLSAELSRGRGTTAWQHAQLFREPVGSTTYPFNVVIKLRKM